MISILITFDNTAQIRTFREKIVNDFRCSDESCSSCKDSEVCSFILRLVDTLENFELKDERKKK